MTGLQAMKKRARKADETVRFRAWLSENGAEVLEPTNPYEVIRFRTANGTSIIYRKDNGQQTFTGESGAALKAFREGKSYRMNRATPHKRQGDPVQRAIAERDGNSCFYCDVAFTEAVRSTIEHLVSRTHGGPDHIANKFLSCPDCNRKAGHLSAPEKIKLRDKLRAEARSRRGESPPDAQGTSSD